MMKTLAAVAALTALAAPAAFADDTGLYGQLDIGKTANGDVNDFALPSGDVFGARVGQDWGMIRADVGARHISIPILSVAEASAIDYHAAVYVDLPTPISAETKAFAGIGVDYVDAEVALGSSTIDLDGDGYRLTAGLSHDFGPVTLEAAWTRLDAGLTADGFGDVDATEDTLTLGLRFG